MTNRNKIKMTVVLMVLFMIQLTVTGDSGYRIKAHVVTVHQCFFLWI